MNKFLETLQKEIHTIVLATVDENNKPITCVIDIMLSDDNGVYFITAKGKNLYSRLKNNNAVSLSGFIGKDTMSSKAISLSGAAKEIGSERLEEVFEKNPYMNEIYPSCESKKALTVFHIADGKGEYFDLTTKPITRESFVYGNGTLNTNGYVVNDNCTLCKECEKVCPQNCISFTEKIAVISENHCLHCGRCLDVCPAKAISHHQ